MPGSLVADRLSSRRVGAVKEIRNPRMNQYFEQMILSASPVELVNLLYQRAIRSVRDARAHMQAGRIQERCHAINHAWAVLLELLSSLDSQGSPEISSQLHDLYTYMQRRLVDANLKKEEGALSEVLMLLSTLAEGWSGVMVEERRRHETDEWSEVPVVEGEAYRFAVSA
jgi:flagellar protein FliS